MRIKQRGPNMTEVQFNNGTLVFFSYETPVAAFRPHVGYVQIEDSPSRTTTRHINDWLKANNADPATTPKVPGESLDGFIGAV